ncbi:SAM domain-containing protein SAMSN-1-like [Lates japonicus]
MNLFCFTLEGSTDSIYEPAYSQTFKDILPKYQCSPGLLRCQPEWGGSDPSISSHQPQNAIKLKRNNRRSCVPQSQLDNETLEKDINHACWMSSADNKDLSHQKKVPNRETRKAPSRSNMLTGDDRVKEVNSDRTQTDLPAQGSETVADTAESIHAKRRIKKLQSLVQAKKGHQSGAGKGKNTSENNDHLADVLSNNNPVLTCIGLGRKTERSPKTVPSPQQQQAKDHEYSEEEGLWSHGVGNHLWSPFECSQPWAPFYHTCHQPRHDLWVCGGTLSLPRTTEWDRFESLIQELDNKQSNLSPPQMIRSITDLHLSQNMPKQDPAKSRLQAKQMEASSQSDRDYVRASPERALTGVINGDMQKNEAAKEETSGGHPFTKGHRQSSNSLESLYSLNSGRSSSSGVTCGSTCSSNRGSLRLEDDLLYTRQFCDRARVHTDYVPSPYDTESLKLKVGDVIDIIAKPPMGIWTGRLNGRVGNFKFIYVDVLTEESPETHEERHTHKVRQKSTVHEVLKHLSLEEYSSSLQRNGYQTVDDLMKLREHHLMELNVTDPEHRHRLLTAVNSLQQLCSDSQLENEANQEADTPGKNMKPDMNNCSRDSGCPDNGSEDADLHFYSEQPEMTAS